MDHVDGVNLATILARLRATTALPPPVAAFVALQISHGLDHAHHLTDQGHPVPLVHGTLWPPNVLVSRRGEVFVTDFGSWVIPAAMQREGGAYSIRTQFSYRSPEHVNGDTLTCATDIFCVGILLYEMLSARPPFLGSTLLDTLELVETAKIDSLDHIPPALQSVLRRCLAQDPRHRFTDAAGLISELSVAVPGAGGRDARQELASFVQSLIPEDRGVEGAAAAEKFPAAEVLAVPAAETTEEVTEEEPDLSTLAPEPIEESGAKPLSPIPGLDRETDEPTHINPTEVTEALAALSKDATDPGNLDQIDLDEGEDEEPTRIDPIIPGITGPLSEETDLEGPTNVVPPAEAKLLWEVDEQTVPVPGTVLGTEQDETTSPYTSLFPDEKPTDPLSAIPGTPGIADRDTDERHLEEEELTAPTAPEPDLSKRNLTFDIDTPDDEPTHPSSVEETTEQPGAVVPVPGGHDLIKDEDEPTIQSVPRPNAMTLLGVGESATPAPPPNQAPPQRAEPIKPLPAPPKAQPLPAPLKARPQQPPLQAQPQQPPISPTFPAPAVPPARPKWGEDSAPSLAGLVNLPPSQPPPPPQQQQEQGQAEADQPLSFIPSDPGFASDVDSEFSTYDGGNVVSVTFDRPTRRFTAAHLLLLVAIVVFLVAIGLLLRRLMMSTSIDQQPGGSIADASADLPPPHGTKKPSVDARSSDTTRPKIHESGEHLKHLLHGSKIQRGSVKITSTPPGDVYVNRRLLGRSPVTAKARPGSTLQVVVIANTFKVHRQELKLPEDKGLSLDVRLEKGFYPRATGRRRGWLSIRCRGRIKWRFSLNGKDTGYGCPRVIFRLKPGRYMVSFISPFGKKVRKRRVRIRWGRKVRLRAPRK
jgi:serine/threonine protein kinase